MSCALFEILHFGFHDLLLLQALTVIAFNDGELNLDTFKMLLSIGPTVAIMNFLESKHLHLLVLFSLAASINAFVVL